MKPWWFGAEVHQITAWEIRNLHILGLIKVYHESDNCHWCMMIFHCCELCVQMTWTSRIYWRYNMIHRSLIFHRFPVRCLGIVKSSLLHAARFEQAQLWPPPALSCWLLLVKIIAPFFGDGCSQKKLFGCKWCDHFTSEWQKSSRNITYANIRWR